MTNRQNMIEAIREFLGPKTFIKTTEEFSPEMRDGIWMTNAVRKALGGWRIYDVDFETGPSKVFGEFLKKHGWTLEMYDGDTVMLYPA